MDDEENKNAPIDLEYLENVAAGAASFSLDIRYCRVCERVYQPGSEPAVCPICHGTDTRPEVSC